MFTASPTLDCSSKDDSLTEPKQISIDISSTSSASYSKLPNASQAFTDHTQYIKDINGSNCESFIKKIIGNEIDGKKILKDENLWNEDIFTTTCISVAKKFEFFDNLRESYQSLKQLKRETEFSKTLTDVEDIQTSISVQFKSIVSVQTNASLGISVLSRREKILDLTKSLILLQAKLSDKDTLNSFSRRIKQMKQTKTFSKLDPSSTHISISCKNTCSLTFFLCIFLSMDDNNPRKVN